MIAIVVLLGLAFGFAWLFILYAPTTQAESAIAISLQYAVDRLGEAFFTVAIIFGLWLGRNVYRKGNRLTEVFEPVSSTTKNKELL